MHFAMPPRKTSHPPPFAPNSSRMSSLRRSRLRGFALGALILGAFIFVLTRLFKSDGESIPFGTPPVVLVTVLDPEAYGTHYTESIKENRNAYAAKHGYKSFFAQNTDYDLAKAPNSWSKIPAMRHAMTLYPHSTYFWYLDHTSFIMNPDVMVERDIMDANKMESLMLRDQPIVPPDSVIKTFPQLKGQHIDFAISQDKDGLAPASFILKRGDWARFFLDTWFDPLYRSYNFQKAETHALEHIVQWHPTILSKLAIVPQRTFNAFSKGEVESSIYKDGDFVIRLAGCDVVNPIDCAAVAEPFAEQWRTIFRATG